MATVINLTNASSNLRQYLIDWNAALTSTIFDFNPTYNPSIPSQVYDQWGAGATGANGIYLNGTNLQYTQGDLTGTVTGVYLGTDFQQNGTTGEFSLGNVDLSFAPDGGDPTTAFDYAIYGIGRFNDLSYLYDYFASTGTVINGTAASDTIEGFAGADTVYGGNGDDQIWGLDGDDILYGENGHDQLWGGNGDDQLYGGAGDDKLYGGDGDDVLNGGTGNDTLTGGAGADTFVFTGTDFGYDTVTDFEVGTDTISVSSAVFADFTALLAAADDYGDDVEIYSATYNVSIWLNDVNKADLDANDFIFV